MWEKKGNETFNSALPLFSPAGLSSFPPKLTSTAELTRIPTVSFSAASRSSKAGEEEKKWMRTKPKGSFPKTNFTEMNKTGLKIDITQKMLNNLLTYRLLIVTE